MIFFTADTHFGSERTLQLSRRPFDSVFKMDKEMVENWNSCICDNDIVYHLGDFGNFELLNYLNGNIKLVLGNYEYDDLDKVLKYESKKLKILKKFEYLIDVNGDKFYLIHKPSEMMPEIFNLFGHVHQLSMVKKFSKDSKDFYGLNVGIDCHRFFPIDISVVNFYKNAILNHYDEEVFL